MARETYYPDGKIKTRLTDLIFYEYYPSGVIKIKESLFNGKRNGSYQKYYPNGKLEISGNYVNDKANGLWSFHNKDGTIKTSGIFAYGLPSGVWKYYDDSGLNFLSITFDDGKKQGPSVEYYPNRQVMLKGEYKNDKKDGTWFSYNLNDEITFEFSEPINIYDDIYEILEYDGGKLINRTIINDKDISDEDYEPLETDSLPADYSGNVEVRDEKGNIIKIELWENGKFVNLIKEREYYPNGNIKTKIFYSDGRRERLLEYDYKGKVIRRVIYEDEEDVIEYELINKNEEITEKEYIKGELVYIRIVTPKYVEQRKAISGNLQNGEVLISYNPEISTNEQRDFQQDIEQIRKGEYIPQINLIVPLRRNESIYYGKLVNGVKEGEWYEGYTATNSVEDEYQIKQYLGEYFEIAIGNYSQGLKNGRWIFKYSNFRGDKDIFNGFVAIVEYKNGVKDGLYSKFYIYLGETSETKINRRIRTAEGHYCNNIRCSFWKFYDLEGKHIDMIKYIDGNPTRIVNNYNAHSIPTNISIPYGPSQILFGGTFHISELEKGASHYYFEELLDENSKGYSKETLDELKRWVRRLFLFNISVKLKEDIDSPPPSHRPPSVKDVTPPLDLSGPLPYRIRIPYGAIKKTGNRAHILYGGPSHLKRLKAGESHEEFDKLLDSYSYNEEIKNHLKKWVLAQVP